MDTPIETVDHMAPLRTPDQEETYPALGPPEPPKNYSEEYAKDKSKKYSYALDNPDVSVNYLYSSILNNGPDDIAKNIAVNKDIEDEKARVSLLFDVAKETKGQRLDRPTYEFVNSLSRKELQDTSDPKWKANDVYAQKVAAGTIASTDWASRKFFEKDYSKEEYHAPRDVAEAMISWKEDVYDTIEGLNAQWGGKSFAGKGYEYFEQWIVPFASYFNKRNTVEGPGVGSLLQGENLTEQYAVLNSLPLEQRRKVFKRAVETIAQDNILDAIEFAQGALQYSRSQAILDNAFSVLELTSIGDVASLLKGAGKKGAQKGAGKAGGSAVDKVISGEGEDLNGIADNIAKAVKNRPAPGTAPKAPRRGTGPDLAVSLNGTDVKASQATAEQINIARARYTLLKQKIKKGIATKADESSFERYQKWIDKASGKTAPQGASSSETVVNRMREALKAGDVPDRQFAETAARDAIEAADPTNPHIESDLLTVAGREAEGAARRAETIEQISRLQQPPTNARGRAELEGLVPSMFSPRAQASGRNSTGRLSNRLAQRIAQEMNRIGRILDKAMADSNAVVSRIGNNPALYDRAIQVAEAEFKKHFPGTEDSILDVHLVVPEKNAGNAIEAYTILGRPDQTLFDAPEHAFHMATTLYNFRKNAFDVVQQGNKFAIRMKSTVSEDNFKDLLIPADGSNSTPVGIFNTILGKIRTTDDLISKTANENRHAVTHAYAGLQSAVKQASEAISKVKRIPGAMKRFERVLKAGLHETTPVLKNRRNPTTGAMEQVLEDVPGKEWDAAGFQKKYLQLNGQLPTEEEIIAYEVYKKLNDFDEAIRNLDLYSEKAALGYREWRIPNGANRGWSPTFDGKLVDDLPFDHPDESVVAVYTGDNPFANILDVKHMTASQKEAVQRLKEEGYQIVQIMNPDMRPLREILDSNEAVNFVMVKGGQSSPLKYKQLPTKFGGHRIVDEGWFIKAPRTTKTSRKVVDESGNVVEQDLGRTTYDGDLTLFGVHSEAKAKEILPYLEKARQLFLAGDRGAFASWVGRYLPKHPDRVWKDFEEGIIPTEHPFFITKSGQGINDTTAFKNYAKNNLKNMVDTVDSSFNDQRRINKKFAGEKSPDVFSFGREGSENDPVFKFRTARYVEPFTAMTTSMSTLMKNRAFKDYIQHSVNSWVEEFGDLLDVPIEKLRDNPLHYLHNPGWVDKPADSGRLAAAKNARLAVINMLGTRSELRTNIDWMKGKLVDFVYNNVGDKASLYVHDMLLPTANDPMRYIRGAAFHMKIGLFNIVQMFTQSQTLLHMTAITGNPVRAGQSMVGAMMMQYLRWSDNPAILNRIARMASNAGYGTADEFIESYRALQKTKLMEIEGEHAWADDTLDPQIFTGTGKKLLDKGTMFFKMTERNIRIASWNMAFKEWKKANPGKVLEKQADINKVLARQNLLSLNMTSASSAALQKGVFSLPAQFMGYQMRILDQMLGKRLTWKEKARVFAIYNLAYGVPVGAPLGLATPWYDDIIASAEANGYNTNEGAAQLFFKGGLSFVTEAFLGDDYNPGKRYGPGGFNLLKVLLDPEENEDFLFTFMGASTGILGDAARWAQPALTSLWSQVADPEDTSLPLDPQDFVDAFRSISTVNNAVKAYFALEYSSYYSRDGQKVATVDEMDAVAIALFGMVPDRIEKMYRQMNYLKDDKDALKVLEKEYTKNMKAALRATSEDDRELYKKRARIILQSMKLTGKEKARLFKNSLHGEDDLIEKMDEQFKKRVKQRTME